MTKILGRPQGYGAAVPLKLVIREDIPYRSDGVGISPGYYEATWANNHWESGGAELNVIMPRWDRPDAMAEGMIHIFISRTDTGQVVAKHAYDSSQWAETAPGEFRLDKPVGARRWLHTPSGVEVEKRAVDATAEAQGVVADYTNVQKPAIQQQLADIAQSADRAERAADNLASITTTAGQQAADAATSRIDAAVAQVVAGQGLDGAVDTVAQLPSGQAEGTEYTVRQTGTVWRYDGNAWVNTGQGSVPTSLLWSASLGNAAVRAATGASLRVNMLLDSLTYGQDTSSSGTGQPINGAPQHRSPTPIPESLAEALSVVYPGGVADVRVRAYPGDRVRDANLRWTDAQLTADVSVVMAGTNDAAGYGRGEAGPGGDDRLPTSASDFAADLGQFVTRLKSLGQQVILVGPPPVLDGSKNPAIRANADIVRTVAARLGCPFVDAAEILRGLPAGTVLWTDGVHLTPAAYKIIGYHVAALLGPQGSNLPHVAPGTRISPAQLLHTGGVLYQRTSATEGQSIRLNTGEWATLPVWVDAPCRLMVDALGEAAGVLHLVQDGDLQPRQGAQISGSYLPVPVRGHVLRPGPNLVLLYVQSGDIEIDGIRFEAAPTTEERGTARQSELAGTLLSGPDYQFASRLDKTLAINTRTPDGDVTRRITARLSLGSVVAGVALVSGVAPAGISDYLMGTGYLVIRQGGWLSIRTWDRGQMLTENNVTDVFPAGLWNGVMEIEVSPTLLTVWVDGVQRVQMAHNYRQYGLGLVSGSYLECAALSVR